VAVGVLLLLSAAQARAETRLGTTTYTTNQVWTTAGSPYILNGQVKVRPGVTLTIRPGVIVKMTGTTG
jgi:hypothetical protein